MDYERLFARNVASVPPSGLGKHYGLYFELLAQHDDLISLGVGEPDFVTPWNVRQAGIASLEKGVTFYTKGNGLDELREEICAYQKRRFGLDYDPASECMVTVGGSEGIDLLLRAVLNPGDEVIIPEPCYVSYDPIARFCGAVPVPIATKPENGFRLTAEELQSAITAKTKVLILPFPNNPTGAMLHRENLEALAEVLKGTDILVLSDEIYAELVYVGKHVSPAAISEDMRARTVVVNGFSKAYAMTGWRLGYLLAPAPLVAMMEKIHDVAIMCAPTTSQFAAVTALRDGDETIVSMVDSYNLRRRFIIDGLARIGLPCFDPDSTFYVFPSIAKTGLSSDEFCERLLREKHILLMTGGAFGESGEGFVRISYSYSFAHLKEALRRMGEFMAPYLQK